MKLEVNIIPITWNKHKFDLEVIQTFTKEWDYGIYQIYGRHRAYGADVLLYIGKAEDRKFATRLQDGGRLESDFIYSTVEPTHIHLGHISVDFSEPAIEKYKLKEFMDKDKWKENISIAEKLLIATHPPALNLQLGHKFHAMNFREDYCILNFGEYGSLQSEVSTLPIKFCDFNDNYYLRD